MPKETKAEEAAKDETVEVSKDKLDAVLDTVAKQGQDIADLKEQNEILREAASRGRLEEADNKRKEKELPRVQLKVYDGKVVVGWKSSMGKIVYNPSTNTPVGEVLQSVYYFIDGTESEPIDQTLVNRADAREYARIIEDRGEKVLLKFENPDITPQELEIDKKYLNPQ